jgi:hypothetical protein
MYIAIDLDVIFNIIKSTFFVVGGLIWLCGMIFLFRMNTKEGWYLNIDKDKNGILQIPKEAKEFEEWFATEEYYVSFAKRGAYAIIWFFVTILITIMAVVGGSAITDKNPYFKIPCILLLLAMQLISISKLLLIIAEFLEDFILKAGVMFYLSKMKKEQPMCIQETKHRSSVNKDLRDVIKEENKKEGETKC